MDSASDAAIAEPLITRNPFIWSEALDFTTDALERRPDSEAELEALLGEEGIVQHARPLRVVGEDQSERHVEDGHEEADLKAGGRLEVLPREVLPRHVQGVGLSQRHEEPVLGGRPGLYLAGVVEQNRAHRSGNRNLLFDVEQQALVAAQNDAVVGLRTDGADVEAADAVFAAKEQLLEDRQFGRRIRERANEFGLRAHAERQPAAVLQVHHAFEHRLVVVRVAADTGEIDRRGEPLAGRREDRLIDRVVDVRRHHLADDAFTVRADQQRVGQERVALQHVGLLVQLVDLGYPHPLIAVVHEHPREPAHRQSEREDGAGGLLRELSDVADILLEDVDPAGDVAIEQERLGERGRVVLRPRAGLHRDGQALAASHEVRGLKRQLAEHAFELRHAGAERQLVAVLLFQLQLDVDLVRVGRRFLDIDLARFTLERLEITELVQPLDAELQRLGVEHAVFEQADLAPDHVVVRRDVADERDAVDEELLPFLHLHRHVDDWRALFLRAAVVIGLRRLEGVGRLRLVRVGIVARLEIRVAGEFPVADAAVDFARFLEPFANLLLGVVFAGGLLEERLQVVGLDDGVARDVEVADLVALALVDRNPEFDPTGLLVVGVAQHLELGHADVGANVAAVAVERLNLLRVVVELRFLIRAVVADDGEKPGRKVDEILKRPALPVFFQLTLERAVAHRLVAHEIDLADFDLGTFFHREGD